MYFNVLAQIQNLSTSWVSLSCFSIFILTFQPISTGWPLQIGICEYPPSWWGEFWGVIVAMTAMTDLANLVSSWDNPVRINCFLIPSYISFQVGYQGILARSLSLSIATISWPRNVKTFANIQHCWKFFGDIIMVEPHLLPYLWVNSYLVKSFSRKITKFGASIPQFPASTRFFCHETKLSQIDAHFIS